MAKMYFGTKERMLWIPCPQVDRSNGKQGWATDTQYLNGGAYVRHSYGAHRDIEMDWNLISKTDAQRITSFHDGVGGSGLIYWTDPMAAGVNVLPSGWAFPGQASLDGPPIGYNRTAPTGVQTPPNTLEYPTISAQYTMVAGQPGEKLWIPLPPGHVAHIGVHGTATGTAALSYLPTLSTGGDGAPVALTMLSVTNPQRFNATLDADAASGLTLQLTGAGTITLSGIMVQILRKGVNPRNGVWLNGEGASGCRFADRPQETDYSAVANGGEGLKGVSANFVEVGSWL